MKMQFDFVEVHLCQNDEADTDAKNTDSKKGRGCLPFPKVESNYSAGQHKQPF